jgi:spiro-SPASM protein
MKALCVLFAGGLAPQAFEPEFSGAEGAASAFVRAQERARLFPGVCKTAVFGREGASYPGLASGAALVTMRDWNKKALLEELSRAGEGFDLTYFAWADCPLLDPALAGALAERHLRYAADYSYADGWPEGFAPELLAPGTAGVLAKMLEGSGGDGGAVDRDAVFQVLQRDINNFDIETEISPVDLRQHRLRLAADSKRNLLLLRRLVDGGLKDAAGAAGVIARKPELLRTLPNFFAVQAVSRCPQECALCPWPARRPAGDDVMPLAAFEGLLDKIAAFAGDAVIDISLWGEIALHPERAGLIRAVLARKELSLIVETAGIGWNGGELEALAREAASAEKRVNGMAPLSWIVSLDALDGARYRETRGPGQAEAEALAERLLALFPEDAYLQAVRCKGAEDDIERFYRRWKEAAPSQKNIIIQKYDDFCGALPRLQATDLSPVKRHPCWHLLRDMTVLADGRVPECREDLAALGGGTAPRVWGNVFHDPLERIWENGAALYQEHCEGRYQGICADCDEYYTYNY